MAQELEEAKNLPKVLCNSTTNSVLSSKISAFIPIFPECP